MHRNDILIIIPSYRPGKLLSNVLKQLKAMNYERILVVDDCCPENSGRIVEKFGVECIKTEINSGVGGAFKYGFEYMTSSKKYDKIKYVAKIDADFQHEGAYIPLMTQILIDESADYVKGDRYGLGRMPERQPFVRKAGNICLSFLTKLSTGFWHINDPLNGQFVFDRRILKRIIELDLIEDRYLFETSLLTATSKLKAKVVDCPNVIKYGEAISSMDVKKELFRFSKYHLKCIPGRLWRQYFYPNFDLNCLAIIASFGFPIGSIYAFYHFLRGVISGYSNEPGVLIISTISIIIGYISILIFLMEDKKSTLNNKNISKFIL